MLGFDGEGKIFFSVAVKRGLLYIISNTCPHQTNISNTKPP